MRLYARLLTVLKHMITLKNNEVDLVLTDIKMPKMTGLELLRRVREENLSEAFFIILTGFKDFSYVQEAIRYNCMEYLLKPVEKAELISILRRISKVSEERLIEKQSRQSMEQAYLARNLIALLTGKYDDKNVLYVKNNLQLSDSIRYADIEMADFAGDNEELEEGEMRARQRKMFEVCLEYLKDEAEHCIFDVSNDIKSYDIGLIYCDYFASKRNVGMNEFFNKLKDYVYSQTGYVVNVFVGKEVNSINAISKSYSSACVLKSLEAFRTKKEVYFYDNEISAGTSGTIMILKDKMDELVRAVGAADKDIIRNQVFKLYEELNNGSMSQETVRLNINYLLFQFIHMATELDSELNQEEILRFIAEYSTEVGMLRGSCEHMVQFACDYSDYLGQLKKNVSTGVLAEIEREVRDNYSQNLTLRDLGKKYYINSSYLGQIFQKKYGLSFKDYLASYRIEKAKELLTGTDMKITQIAESVGYKDSDYFLKKFIEANGCTPTKYRKSNT